MSTEPEEKRWKGPPSYANWKEALNGAPSYGAYEFPLYTDAVNLTGEVSEGLGPYQFFNLIAALREPGVVREAIVVRIEKHILYDIPKMEKTTSGYYHGGDINDEIAALASLVMGIRLRAGAGRRQFSPNGDPRGHPYAYDYRPPPPTILTTRHEGRFIVPSATAEHLINVVEIWARYPTLNPDTATTLIRVARLYQDALWFAESEPNLAWLLLVSALETAANHWRTTQDTPLEKLRASKPELLIYLESLEIGELPTKVAEYIHDSLGSTKKFTDFVLEHLPPPPAERPVGTWAQVSWQADDMRRTLAKIYGYRSRALHSGVPFPAPMCQPPFHHDFEEWKGYEEVPLGLASYAHGGIWLAKDVPILLHTFEYIARNALLKWAETFG